MYCFVINQVFLFCSSFFVFQLFADMCFRGKSTPPDSYFPGTWHVPRNGLIVYLSLGDLVY